jgi:hypothetical protein
VGSILQALQLHCCGSQRLASGKFHDHPGEAAQLLLWSAGRAASLRRLRRCRQGEQERQEARYWSLIQGHQQGEPSTHTI